MIIIRGAGSRIAQEFTKLLPANESVINISRELDFSAGVFITAERFFVCQGLLRSEAGSDYEVSWVNKGQIIKACEEILNINSYARICIMGSESGYSGSYDELYAASKADIHKYIETRKIGMNQQLIGVAPSIIEDSGMTERREDKDVLDRKRVDHPKGRFLKAVEVAKLVHFCLYVDEGYLTNVVLRMNGGLHTR